MARFAEGTTVSVEKSKAEIEAVLVRYGADQFFSAWAEGKAIIGFRAKGRSLQDGRDAAAPAGAARARRDHMTDAEWTALMARCETDDRARLTEPEVIARVLGTAARAGLPVERDHEGARVIWLDLGGGRR